MGCPHDYEFLQEALLPLIERAHNGGTRHCGKVPSRIPADSKKLVQLSDLRRQLEKAVRNEDYELAAQLRDQIQQLE